MLLGELCRQSHVLKAHAPLARSKRDELEIITFSIRLVANPPSNPRSHGGDLSSNAVGTGLFTLDAQHAPVEVLITLASTAGSKPSF